ncbi:amidase family protein [Dyadobacter sp. 3J3]|uniref:amidase family protein n=1 Tax=Dyadobacter sp. 3J3 TaxID=2606600 RepID=UPI0013596299|nr:amidase family protein [Dyadobacter sp. 3J3]
MKNQSNSNTDPIYYQEATTLAKLIRHKEISSVEVVQAHLDRITEVNPKINGIVTLMGEQALISAALADKAVNLSSILK